MIDLEMINKIGEWGFEIEKEYHKKKAHQGIIGINDNVITELELYEIFSEYEEFLINNIDTYDEFLKVIDTSPVYVGDFIIYTKYKLYNDDAIEITTFSDYLGDEFEKYLKDNDIQIYDHQYSDIEEFFEQYGIEVY